MKRKNFNKLAKEYFGEILEPFGFTSSLSKQCTFYRELPNGLFHIIAPNLGARGVDCNVMVYVTSTEISENFEMKFPDEIGSPSNRCYLNTDYGISSGGESFRCNKEEGFIRNFLKKIEPALKTHAIPFLDSIKYLDDYLPYVDNKLALGKTLFFLKRNKDALDVLFKELKRVENIDPKSDLAEMLNKAISLIEG